MSSHNWHINSIYSHHFDYDAAQSGVIRLSRARYHDIWGGRGRGGSTFAAQLAILLIMQKKEYFRGYLLRQTFSAIRTSIFKEIKDLIGTLPQYEQDNFHIVENICYIRYNPTGWEIFSKGVKAEGGQTANLKSLAGATHVFIEEREEIGEPDFNQLDISLRTVKTEPKIISIFNPMHKDHYWWKRHYTLTPMTGNDEGYFQAAPKVENHRYELIDQDGERTAIETPQEIDGYVLDRIPRLCSTFSTYWNNERNLDRAYIDLLESFRKSDPNYYRTVVRGLVGAGQKGQVYFGWQGISDEEFNAIEARSIFGLDWGGNTGGLVEVKVVKSNLYLRELAYGGRTTKEWAILMRELGIQQELVIADSAEPTSIGDMRNGWRSDENEKIHRGFNIYPAHKPKGSITGGISKVKEYSVFVTHSSRNIWDVEYIGYKWALDKDKNPTDEPVDDCNHLLDPMRYVVMAKGRQW